MPAQALKDNGRAGRMNTGWHAGASSEPLLLRQSGTEGYQTRMPTFGHTLGHTSNTSKQTKTKSTVSNSISLHRRYDDQHHSQIENSNDNNPARFAHSSSSCLGKDDNPAITPRSETKKTTKNGDKRTEMSRRNMDRVAGFNGGPSTVPASTARRRVQKETGAVPVPVPGKGTRPSPVQSTSKSKENGQATNQMSRSSSLAIIERHGGVDGSRPRPELYWQPQPTRKKPLKRGVVRNPEATDIIDVDKDAERLKKAAALDAERLKKAAMLKRITFSKKKVIEVKEEVREEEDVLRVVMGGESREAEVNGRVGGEQVSWTCDGQGNIPGLSAASKSARIHRPYDLPQAVGIVNVETRAAVPIPLPSLFPDPPDSVSDVSDDDLYSPKDVEKVGVDVVVPRVQVKEEQCEDEDIFDSPILDPFPDHDLQAPISAIADNSTSYPLDTECTIHPKNKRKQHGFSHAKNVRSPKRAKTDDCVLNEGQGQSESIKEAVLVQDEGDNVPCPSMPALKGKKRGKQSKKKNGKDKGKDAVIDLAETHVAVIGGVPLTGGEDEMAIETKQGEIPSTDTPASGTAGPSDSQTGVGELAGRKESESIGENAQNAEQDERVKTGTEISVAPSTDPLPAFVPVHDTTTVEPSASESVIRRPGRKGKKSGRAAESGGSTDKVTRRKSMRNVKGQATDAGKQTQNHDVVTASLTGGEDDMEICAIETKQGEMPTPNALSLVVSGMVSMADPSDHQIGVVETIGKKESEGTGKTEQDERVVSVHDEPSPPDSVITRPSKKGKKKGRGAENGIGSTDKMPRKKRNVRGQATEASEQTQVGEKEISHPDETPKKKRKVMEKTTEGTERGLAADVHIPQQEKMDDQTVEGGERVEEGSVGDEHIHRQEETPAKMNDQMTESRERTQGGPAGNERIPPQEKTPRKRANTKDEHIPQQEGTPKKREKGKDKTTEGGEHIQGPDDIALLDETPTTKEKAKDQSATEGEPETEKKVVRRGRRPKEKKNDEDTSGETSLLKLTEENGPVKEVKENTRSRKKRATMDEKDGVTDGVVRKKRVKLSLEDGNRQSGKTVKPTVKWMLVCKNRTATGRKASKQSKGKEKAQLTAMASDLDVDEKEETDGSIKTRKTLRPSIWTSSKTELLLVLPELSGSKCFNGITEGSSNFPMVMLDESTAESIGVDVRWVDGEESESLAGTSSVRLTLARDFVCPVPERARTGMDSVAYAASSDAGPSSAVMTQPSVPSSATPGASVLNVYGNGCGPLSVVLPYDDNDGMYGMDLEYIDEDAPLAGAVPTLSYPSVNMSPVSLTPFVPYTRPVTQEAMATGHISYTQSLLQASALPTYHPAIQYNPYNPTTLSTPSAVSIPSLHFQHLFPFQPYQIPFPTTAPVPIPIPSKIPFDDVKPSPPTPSELKSELETIIPPSPPPEIEILTSSSKLSLPLILISSHETFKRHFWGPLTPTPHWNGPSDNPEQAEKVGLAAEHAYVFLGFFRVVEMGEKRVTLSDEERVNLTPGKVAGRVEWTFDIEWVPGYHGSKGSEELIRPWWAPDFVFDRPVGRESESEKWFIWLEKHAQARLNLLPVQLVDGQEAGSSDEAMPKGWLCKTCGKLNQKVMMRHRWCGSRMCRDNPLSRGYAVYLSGARDANQTPLALPINTYNRRTVDASVADWDDGMRTLKYRPVAIPDRLGNAGTRSGILQHVFTCNLVDLQTEATSLFENIQSNVCLMKSTGDSGPFFKSHVSDSYANKREKYAFSCLSWSEAPQVVGEAQELMTFMGKKYGEEEALDIDKLTIVGWVSSGTRKTPTILAAREHAIAMLCLGNDVVLTIVPKWEEVSAPKPGPFQVQQTSNLAYPLYVPPSANQMQLVDVAAVPATENHVQQVGAISENPPSGVVPAQITSKNNNRSKPASKIKPKPKQALESMSVTLVHGDMLLFSRCDFEYSIKRMGTSILVIGSKEDSTASI